MIHFDEFRESEMADLAAIDRAARIRLRKLMAHPDCRDPDHPGCNRCNEEELPMTVICSYCNRPVELVTGKEIYPHRPDLYSKKFWRCRPCAAYVGCHKPNVGYGDGTRPLGRLANAELRAAKSAAHAAFDTVWKNGFMRRGSAYAWLADKLGIPPKQCHIGDFDVGQCKRVVQIVKENYHELEARR